MRPGLFAWGSPQWITRMIRRPTAPDLYGYYEAKDHMPPFGPDQMTANDVEMIIRYLKNDYPMPATAGIDAYHCQRPGAAIPARSRSARASPEIC